MICEVTEDALRGPGPEVRADAFGSPTGLEPQGVAAEVDAGLVGVVVRFQPGRWVNYGCGQT